MGTAHKKKKKHTKRDVLCGVIYSVKIKNSQNGLQKKYDNNLHYSHTNNKPKTDRKMGKCL